MDTNVKDKIIDLVQRSTNGELLDQVYAILDSNLNYREGQIFQQLTVEEQAETIKSLKESEEEKNLIDHDTAMKDIRKKFGWD